MFIADTNGFGLVVLNNFGLQRLDNPEFRPEPDRTTVDIAGVQFELVDGIIGMAVTSKIHGFDSKYLIYRPFASLSLYAADLRQFQSPMQEKQLIYLEAIDIFPSQVVSITANKDGVVFFSLTHELALACLNMRNPMSKEYLVST